MSVKPNYPLDAWARNKCLLLNAIEISVDRNIIVAVTNWYITTTEYLSLSD